MQTWTQFHRHCGQVEMKGPRAEMHPEITRVCMSRSLTTWQFFYSYLFIFLRFVLLSYPWHQRIIEVSESPPGWHWCKVKNFTFLANPSTMLYNNYIQLTREKTWFTHANQKPTIYVCHLSQSHRPLASLSPLSEQSKASHKIWPRTTTSRTAPFIRFIAKGQICPECGKFAWIWPKRLGDFFSFQEVLSRMWRICLNLT